VDHLILIIGFFVYMFVFGVMCCTGNLVKLFHGLLAYGDFYVVVVGCLMGFIYLAMWLYPNCVKH
jgi:hypothetical protein